MTSKSSFLVNMKENNKRRLWVWVISALGFMLFLPLYIALQISQIRQQSEWLITRYGNQAAEKVIHENLLDMMKHILGASEILFILTAVLAVVSAVQGFSWLYSRKKIDFYMGMPVKRSKRLLVIWVNGILLYLVPYILGLVIGMLIAAGNQGLNAGVVKVIFQALFINLLLYLCIYHMAMLAVMLTGNIVITGMGFMVFCLYEWLVRRADYTYKSRFFRYFTRYSNQELYFSPFNMYSEIVSSSEAMTGQGKTIMLMILFAAVAGGLACLAYFKRPAEGAGKAMVFEFTKPIIKILLVIPMALVVGDMIASDVNYAPGQGMHGGGYVFFALALVTILGCAAIQVLYEFDIKGALHQKRHILISGVLVALIFSGYRYDLLHFDSYVPDADDVESIAFYPYQYDTADYSDLWFEPEQGGIGGRNYVDQYMYLTNVEDICALVKYSMEKYDKDMEEYEKEGHNSDLVLISDSYWSEAVITYRLKNGREVMRNLWIDVNDANTAEYLDRIIGSDEFKEGYLMAASGRLSQILEQQNETYKISAYYGNTIYAQKMSQEEVLELLECYQADMEFYNFTNVKESTPAGMIAIEFEREMSNGIYGRGTATTELGINIYPFFENSIACLKKFGFYMEKQVNVEDVDRIYITNYNSEANAKLQRNEEEEVVLNDSPTAWVYGADSGIDTRISADYTDKAQIEALADSIYADGILSGRWDNGAMYDADYEVVVYFKAESDMSRKYGTSAEYKFKEGEIPDFVKADTTFLVEDK